MRDLIRKKAELVQNQCHLADVRDTLAGSDPGNLVAIEDLKAEEASLRQERKVLLRQYHELGGTDVSS